MNKDSGPQFHDHFINDDVILETIEDYVEYVRSRPADYFANKSPPSSYDFSSMELLEIYAEISRRYMHCTIAYTSLLAWMLDHDTCTVDDIRRIGLVVPAPFVRKLHVLKAVIEAGVFDRFYGTLMIHQFYDHTPELVDFARDGGFYVTETKGRFDNLVVFVEDVLMPELRTFVESLPANDPMRHTLYDYCSGERFEGQSLDDVVPDLFPT